MRIEHGTFGCEAKSFNPSAIFFVMRVQDYWEFCYKKYQSTKTAAHFFYSKPQQKIMRIVAKPQKNIKKIRLHIFGLNQKKNIHETKNNLFGVWKATTIFFLDRGLYLNQ